MIDPEIVGFIKEQKVATVACVENNLPYCFNCYYSFIEQDGLLVYKSSFNTRHESILQNHKDVAGTIIPEQIDVAIIKGIQFEGKLLDDNLELAVKVSASYYLRFPFALTVPGKLYVIEISSLKFTDNTRGFGFKQHWRRK
ncbi:MAG TPA: hypothetical protein PL009_07620 [Flavipsychrobacter sp.]|nr:hypothetical protein [Flavipsychrobacter sp.]